jgi:hypothetical protein
MKIDNALLLGAENGEFPPDDPLVVMARERNGKMHAIFQEKEAHDFKWFKEMFLATRREILQYIPSSLPKVAKMGVGRNVMFEDFVKHHFEHHDYSTWAVYLIRLFSLYNNQSRKNGVFPLLWHMFHGFGYQQEWSKTDHVWAMKNERVPKPEKDSGPLCYFKARFDEDGEALGVRDYVIQHTVFANGSGDSEKKLGRANHRVSRSYAVSMNVQEHMKLVNKDFFETERKVVDELTHDIGWIPWFNHYFYSPSKGHSYLLGNLANSEPIDSPLARSIQNMTYRDVVSFLDSLRLSSASGSLSLIESQFRKLAFE